MLYPLPLRDDAPVFHATPVTRFLFWSNIGIFILLSVLTPYDLTVARLGLVPAELLRLTDLPPFAPWPPPVNLLSHMFLHGGILHLAGNMLFLHIFGNNVEDMMGSARFLVFYLLCGIVAGLSFSLAHSSSGVPLVGASGAISGVMGAYIIRFPRARIDTAIMLLVFVLARIRIPAFILLGCWVWMQFLSVTSGRHDGVAYEAHLAGFILGMLVSGFFINPLYRRWQLRR